MSKGISNQAISVAWLLIILILVGIGAQKVYGTASFKPVIQDGNLIQNPGFEGDFHAWRGIPEIQVAANWTPWWWDNPDHDPAYFRPEYKRAVAAAFPKRVLSGGSSQQYFTFHASHLAGMYQQVFNVTPGQRYRFSIWAQVWSSTEDDPNSSVLPANPHLQIGIDPTGNWNPGSPEVIWSPEASMGSVVDKWGQLSVEATAQNDIITVFMRTNPDFANKHNDMYWDNASLNLIGPPEPTPLPPTDTPGPPTNTPEITSTAPPTQTPIPIEPSSTPTNTHVPTNTPTPTDTPTATNTATSLPSPTSTPSSSPTPIPPSSTPTSSLTPEPTQTVQGTEIASATVTARNTPDPSSESLENEGDIERFGPILFVGMALVIALLAVVVVWLIRRVRSG